MRRGHVVAGGAPRRPRGRRPRGRRGSRRGCRRAVGPAIRPPGASAPARLPGCWV